MRNAVRKKVGSGIRAAPLPINAVVTAEATATDMDRPRTQDAKATPRKPGPRLTRHRALRSYLFLPMILWIGSLSACGEPDIRPFEDQPQRSLNVKTQAAHRGIAWLIENASEMPPGWAYPNLVRTKRLTTSPTHQERISEALEFDRLYGQHRALPKEFTSIEFLTNSKAIQLLFEIVRRKETGQDWQSAAADLDVLVSQNETELWKATLLRDRPTVLHALSELEIETLTEEELFLNALREQSRQTEPRNLAGSTRYMYAITHVVLARSNYFKNSVPSEGLEFMQPIFLAALERHTHGKMGVMEIDLVGEVLTCLELLGIADPRMEKARVRLIRLQNEDGSWGTGREISPKRIHPTFNATAGLLDFHEVLPRPEP